jgi:Tol biopolymer transport system component
MQHPSHKEEFVLNFLYGRSMQLSLLCLVALMALASCASKPNRFGIVFTSDSGIVGAIDVYQIPDNTQDRIERLTFTPTIGEYYLLVSNNGDSIIFEANYTGLTEEPSELAIENFRHIYLLDTTSKELEDMTDVISAQPFGTETSAADWSPDKKQLAVLTYERDLGIMDFDGSNRRLIFFQSLGENPNIDVVRWSPDGRKLALNYGNVGLAEQLQNPGSALVIYDLGNEELRQLADYQENCHLPKWSPTSRQVVASCASVLPYTESSGPDTLRIFSTEDPPQPYERLALSPCHDPSWSPDGGKIVFVCSKGSNQMGLFIINSDGNGIYEVKLDKLGSAAVLRYPVWSPDGSQIIYVAGADPGHGNIYSVTPDGSSNYALTHHDADYQVVSVYPVP